jgi:hypothetical protein
MQAPMRQIFWLLMTAAMVWGQRREISVEELRDRIAGAWAGQMIGVSYGAPTEFRSNGKILEGDLPPWNDRRVENSIQQDDLYVDMTFMKVLDEKGPDATTADYGGAFKETQYSLWHANLAARRALRRGIPAELTGTPRYNVHANDIDFQIEADFAGIITPGMPRAGLEIASRAGRVMNYGDGLLGGYFVTCMYSAAYFEKDPVKVVEAGLACLPRNSGYYRIISDTLAAYRAKPGDWKAAWQMLQNKWDQNDVCPEGALRPFNIDATLNGAYIALGLLFGDGDFFRTMDISTRAGQDSDCNPASACGVLGAMRGCKGLPDEWKRGIPAIAQRKFAYTDYSFETIIESSVRLASAIAVKRGGEQRPGSLLIRTEAPVAKPIPLWNDYGRAVERIPVSDARWKWSGTWKNYGSDAKLSDSPGAEAQVQFEGTGFIVAGWYLPAGGKAELWIDGKKAEDFDANSDEVGRKSRETYGHRFDLKPGPHTIAVKVLGQPFRAEGAEVAIQDLVVFRK